MKRCKYCSKKLLAKNGNYMAERWLDTIHDGGGWRFNYWHIKCKKTFDRLKELL